MKIIKWLNVGVFFITEPHQQHIRILYSREITGVPLRHNNPNIFTDDFFVPCYLLQTRCAGKSKAVFGLLKGCSGLAAAMLGDVIFGSIAEDVLPPVW